MTEIDLLQENLTPTSKLINSDAAALNRQKYYGYVEKFTILGKTSGAIAKIDKAQLISDNWGDIIACFFFRIKYYTKTCY